MIVVNITVETPIMRFRSRLTASKLLRIPGISTRMYWTLSRTDKASCTGLASRSGIFFLRIAIR